MNKYKSNPRAFLSFDFDHDRIDKMLFAGQAKPKSPTPFTLEDWSSKSSLPQDKWKEQIKNKMANTNMLIVLVGKYMASAAGVKAEILMAHELDIPVFGVYISQANISSNLPDGLYRSRTVTWDWNKIDDMINKCMNEGKNIL